MYLSPTLVMLLGLVFYQRRISARQLLGMAISYAGVVLVFGHEITLQGASAAWGALLVFLSAVSYALYLRLPASDLLNDGAYARRPDGKRENVKYAELPGF